MGDAEQEGGEAAPVVPDHVDALDPERVEQGDLIRGEGERVIALARRVGPAEAAKVGGDQAVAVAQPPDHAAPHPVVLGPAVEEEDRAALARLGVVDPEPAGDDVAVLGALDGGGSLGDARHACESMD